MAAFLDPLEDAAQGFCSGQIMLFFWMGRFSPGWGCLLDPPLECDRCGAQLQGRASKIEACTSWPVRIAAYRGGGGWRTVRSLTMASIPWMHGRQIANVVLSICHNFSFVFIYQKAGDRLRFLKKRLSKKESVAFLCV